MRLHAAGAVQPRAPAAQPRLAAGLRLRAAPASRRRTPTRCTAEVTPPAPLGAWPKPRSWEAVAASKVADLVEDVLLIARRTLFPRYASLSADAALTEGALGLRSSGRPVVLVLGSGWAAHAFIKVIDTDAFEVVVVSPRNYFVFTPMLTSSVVGTVEFRSLLEPVRVANPCVTYLEARCEQLDTGAKVATCAPAAALPGGSRPPFRVAYDVAVIACGEEPATLGVPGVAEHCCFLKEVSDAAALRRRIGECFDLAALPGCTDAEAEDLLHFLVVGGGATGVEFAAALAGFVRSDLAAKYAPALVAKARVTLLQSGDTILTQFDASLAAAATETLRAGGVEVRTRARVAAVRAGAVTLRDGEEDIRCGLCVWAVGNAPRPLVTALRSALQPEAVAAGGPGKLSVDPWLRALGARDVLALGDCAMAAERAGTLGAAPRLPATAQVAAQQGAYAARLINRGFALGAAGLDAPPPHRSSPTPPLGPASSAREAAQPFEFLSLGLLAALGDDDALTQLDAGGLQLRLSGRVAAALWRSVYLTKQVSLRNRVLILFDWAKTRVFGRDLSQF